MTSDRLLALDLDGTLLRSDGTIDPRDLAAIRRARVEGCAVTLATGRVTATTIHVARALRLDVPLVCADGRIVAHPESGVTIELHPVPERVASVQVIRDHELAALAITPTCVVHEPGARAQLGWIDAACESLECEEVDGHADTVMALGVGDVEAVTRAATAIGDRLGTTVQVDTYPLGAGPHAVRVWARGHDKQTGLARVAAQLGIAAANVATVGDWFNDIGMLQWAGRSFAMAGAPVEVIAAAREALDARAGKGGGVAEAIERWLGG